MVDLKKQSGAWGGIIAVAGQWAVQMTEMEGKEYSKHSEHKEYLDDLKRNFALALSRVLGALPDAGRDIKL